MGAPLQFRTFGAFNSHVYRHHRDALNLTCVPENISTVPLVTNDSTLTFHSVSEDLTTVTPLVNQSQSDSIPLQFSPHLESLYDQKEAANYFLRLSQHHHLSISDMISRCQEQFQCATDYISALIANRMTESGINRATITKICCIKDSLPKPFSGLETTYLQEKNYQEIFPYVVRKYFKILSAL